MGKLPETGLMIPSLSQSDVGFTYRAVISYIDGFGTRETLVTDSSETVANIDNPLKGK